MFKAALISLLASTLLIAQADQIARQEQEKKKPAPAPVINMHGTPQVDQAAAARGKAAFETACGFCHGPDARGKSGPDLLRSSLVLHDDKGSQIGPVIRNGRPDRGMPPFPAMTNDQLSDISAFLHAGTLAVENRFAYEIKGILTGDPKQGEAFFNGDGHCIQCHSPTGDFAHIAAKYEAAELQRRMLMPTPNIMDAFMGKTVKPPKPSTVKLTLPSGETFSGTLIHADEFTVVVNNNGAIKSFDIDSRAKVEINNPLAVHEAMLPQYTDAQMHNLLAYLETMK